MDTYKHTHTHTRTKRLTMSLMIISWPRMYCAKPCLLDEYTSPSRTRIMAHCSWPVFPNSPCLIIILHDYSVFDTSYVMMFTLWGRSLVIRNCRFWWFLVLHVPQWHTCKDNARDESLRVASLLEYVSVRNPAVRVTRETTVRERIPTCEWEAHICIWSVFLRKFPFFSLLLFFCFSRKITSLFFWFLFCACF